MERNVWTEYVRVSAHILCGKYVCECVKGLYVFLQLGVYFMMKTIWIKPHDWAGG